MSSAPVRWIAGILFLAVTMACLAQADSKSAADRVKEEIAQHRRLAEVHENAARCLASGKPEKECHDQLQKACKGVGIGKHCGLRHAH
jgi:hypothetical protein